jgi:amino acid transporter
MSVRSTALTILRTAKAVAWSFIGLRGGNEAQQDVKKLHPLHVIAVGLIFVFLFVGALVLLVHWVVPTLAK